MNNDKQDDLTGNIVERYLATWNADGAERAALLSAHWAADVTYVDPMAEVSGADAVGELIGAVRAQFPGFVFSQVAAADAHHRQLRFPWGLGQAGEEPAVVGFDVVVVDDAGRIQDVRGFLDRVPA
ncbi:MAG: nuclear transport factor 2 family protein [Pseudoclavibacter sp.]